MDSDANFLELARKDAETATCRIIDALYERVYAFLRRLSGSDADAADLTQKVFGQVQHSLPRFEARSSLSSWVHGIAYHLYLDWRRSSSRMEFRSDAWWAQHSDQGPRPDENVAHSDLSCRIYACVDRMDPILRDSVHLHYYQGLTLQETADAMGVAASTIKYRLRQAVEILQKELRETKSLPRLPQTSDSL